ncbi:MAG: DUF4386 domain-containing protein [Candidatus Odinarchaeota archaeon]
MNIEIWLSGFFFLFIIVTNLAGGLFGYKTVGDVDSEAQLQFINKSPIKFKIGVIIILIEHLGIISLAITLLIAFSPYNIILGIIWCISRIIEALIQIYDKKSYWGLLNLAIKYSSTSDVEKNVLIDSSNNIFKTKKFRFAISQLFFSIGTFAYSILFVAYGVVPLFIGWFGIIASILYVLGSGLFLIKTPIKALWSIAGLLILIFELTLGIWLLWYSVIIL